MNSYFAYLSGLACIVEYDSNPSIHFALMKIQEDFHNSIIRLSRIQSLKGFEIES